MAIINCPNCGKQNPEGTRFCGGCGTQLPQNAAPVNPAPEAQAYRPNLVKPSAPEAQPYKPNLTKPNAQQAPAQPQYYAPPANQPWPNYNQPQPAYQQPAVRRKSGIAPFIIAIILGLVGIILAFLYSCTVIMNPSIALRNLSNNIPNYLISLLVPVIMMLLVRNENQKSLRKTAFIISIVVLVAQLVACCIVAYMFYSGNPMPVFLGRICGSNLINTLIFFVRNLPRFGTPPMLWSLVSLLGSLCFVAKNVIVCVTVGRMAKR